MADRGEPVAVHLDDGALYALTRADGSEVRIETTLDHWRNPRTDAVPPAEMRVTRAYRAVAATPDGPWEITLHQYGADHPDVWRLRWRDRV